MKTAADGNTRMMPSRPASGKENMDVLEKAKRDIFGGADFHFEPPAPGRYLLLTREAFMPPVRWRWRMVDLDCDEDGFTWTEEKGAHCGITYAGGHFDTQGHLLFGPLKTPSNETLDAALHEFYRGHES